MTCVFMFYRLGYGLNTATLALSKIRQLTLNLSVAVDGHVERMELEWFDINGKNLQFQVPIRKYHLKELRAHHWN